MFHQHYLNRLELHQHLRVIIKSCKLLVIKNVTHESFNSCSCKYERTVCSVLEKMCFIDICYEGSIEYDSVVPHYFELTLKTKIKMEFFSLILLLNDYLI